MNPWVVIRREIDGAIRSVRYDLANRRSRQALNEQTLELPVIGAGGSRKQRVILATTAGLVVAGGVGGYFVFSAGLDSLLAAGDSPAGLPATRVKPGAMGTAAPARAAMPGKQSPAKVPVALTSTIRPGPSSIAVTPSGSPPVPTPAPTCNCGTPSPTPFPSPSASPTPSPSSTMPTIAPTSSATR